MTTSNRPWRVCHLFSGLGGGGLGFKQAGFEGVGAFDSDPAACRDFEMLTGEKATVADLGTMTPQDLRDGCTARPDVIFTSPPCKSFSACLPAERAQTEKYVDLSSLALRGIWMALEAWDTPPPLILFENVPRITVRGRDWLDQVICLLHAYGYAVQETMHDCGELGGLAQRRKRFLLVARHMSQVSEFLYVPSKLRVRGVGEVLGHLPLPTPTFVDGGAMHRLPALSALNWLRLALIPAGGDWRDLPEQVALGARRGRINGGFGVNDWDIPSHTVVGEGSVRNTWASVNDPRVQSNPRPGVYGVLDGEAPAPTVIASARMDNGRWSVADPRVESVRREGGHGVKPWDQPSTPIIGHPVVHNGPWQVADPRVSHDLRKGNYGVAEWAEPSHCVIGDARSYKGANVADPRVPAVVGPTLDLTTTKSTHLVIQAADGTWHRPMSTLELAALQGFPTKPNGDWLHLDGRSHGKWRQRIGNAVPPPTARAIASSVAATLRATADGDLIMSSEPVWVAPSFKRVVWPTGEEILHVQ